MYNSKIYSNAIAKYNSGKLLSSEKLRRLIDADFSDAVKMLADYGYGGGLLNENSYDIDVFLTEETSRLIAFVNEDCPGEELKRFLLNKYYYSDAKVLFKAKYVSTDTKFALYNCFDDLNSAVECGDYQSLPAFLSDALIFLSEKYIDKKPSPKEIDITLVNAMYSDSLDAANMSRNRSLKKYIRTEIDFLNIITAFRCRKLKLDRNDFTAEFIGGGTLKEQTVSVIITGEQTAIIKEFMSTQYFEAVDRLYQSEDFVLFERDSGDTLNSIIANSSDDMNSYSPFINYFIAKTVEIKTVKTILVCLKNNARAEIGRRLKTVYDQ